MPRSPLPASTESQCDKLIATMYGPNAIVRLGAKGQRTRNTDGVPDRLYWCPQGIVFFEVKSKTDYLSVPQIAFLMNVLIRHGIAGCGNRDDLCTLLNATTDRERNNVGCRQVEKYRTRQKALRGT